MDAYSHFGIDDLPRHQQCPFLPFGKVDAKFGRSATEIGIEPTVRHAADIDIIPIVVADACSAGHEEAEERSLDSQRFIGDEIISDVVSIETLLRFREK